MKASASTLPKSPAAVPASFALALLEDLCAIGASPEQLLTRLRAPFTLTDLRSARIPVVPNQLFIQIFRECVLLLSSHANRERNLPPMTRDEVEMLCYCVITCENLLQVIDRATRFCAMLDGRAGTLSLEFTGDTAIFHMKTLRLQRSTSGLLADLTGLSFYHRLFSWLIGESIPIVGYGVAYEDRGNRETLLRLFHRPILYAQPSNHFRFPAAYVDKPVVRSYQRLVELLCVFPFDVSSDPAGDGRIAEAVEQLMTHRLARGEPIPTLKQFASFFNVSGATFRRRLAEEHETLGAIKDRCRRQMALELLDPSSRLKISDIAERLGFSDARAFRRAFRTWTDMSPDELRSSRAQGD